MNQQHNLEKLEYKKILDMLSFCCHTFIGKNSALSLEPCFKKDKVQKLLNETNEANILLIRKGNLPLYDIADISSSLKKLKSSISLSAKELLEIAHVFKLSRDIKNYFYKDENFDTSEFIILGELFSKLYSNLDIENTITNAIIDENTIADTASSNLLSIRKNIKKAESDIKESLNHMLHSSNYSNAIMEQIVTIRNDRYVIPIKGEFRGTVKGFIHDISSSGSTVFIEPISVFELNNKLQTLKIEENTEIEHILQTLSQNVSVYVNELQNDVFLIGKLDFIFAKATLAKQMDGIYPILNNQKFIDLKKARHPLIDSKQVVPIDIKIGDSFSSLIITGPNTGGKTVTLKTCGLLCLMAYMGLFIPATQGSSIYVFDNIFADIGDEQSIQESLSTFSSHMTNIINIVKNASKNSLILIDELGAGTDPVEGSCLAISILEYFHNIGSICLTTTHYPEIKNYALVTDGFENASSSFDIENLRPTYQLLIGIPGKSNAFAISKKLGLKDEILLRAKNLLKADDINIEELLKNIYDDKITLEKEKEEIEKNMHQIELLRKSLEKEKLSQLDLKNEKKQKAETEAKNILLSAKSDANDVIRKLNNLYNNLKNLENIDLENWSDTEIANYIKMYFKKGSLKDANELRNKLNTSLNNVVISASTNTTNFASSANISLDSKGNFSKDDLSVGMKVILNNFSEPATIISLSGKKNQMQVQIANAKMSVKVSDISKIISVSNNLNSNVVGSSNIDISKKSSSFSQKPSTSSISLKAKNVSSEINVIGQNVDEACFAIDKYLDNCYLAKLSTVRIVHGKGTGKLRNGIHLFLKNHPHVKSFRVGTFGEGEMGVTVVELK